MTLREKLFKKLFPREYWEWKSRYNHTQTNYDKLVSTLIRSHPEEREWSSRFAELEKDYVATEKAYFRVLTELREEKIKTRNEILAKVDAVLREKLEVGNA